MLLCLLACSACSSATSSSSAMPTAAELPDGPRRPDGVAIDPMSQPPRARAQAGSMDGLVTLRTPLGVEPAVALVAEFFQRVVAEDETIEALFARDALAISSGSSGGQPPAAGLWWGQRFRRLDYRKVAGETLYQEADLVIVRAGDALARPPHPSVRPETLEDEDVVISVKIVLPSSRQDRLFGDELLLWMRRDGDRYRIYRLLEDFQLP